MHRFRIDSLNKIWRRFPIITSAKRVHIFLCKLVCYRQYDFLSVNVVHAVALLLACQFSGFALLWGGHTRGTHRAPTPFYTGIYRLRCIQRIASVLYTDLVHTPRVCPRFVVAETRSHFSRLFSGAPLSVAGPMLVRRAVRERFTFVFVFVSSQVRRSVASRSPPSCSQCTGHTSRTGGRLTFDVTRWRTQDASIP